MNLRLEVLRAKYPEAIRTAEKRWFKLSVQMCLFFDPTSGRYEEIDKWLESQAPEIKADGISETDSYIAQLWVEHETKTTALYSTYEIMMGRWAERFKDRVMVAARRTDDPKTNQTS